MGRGSSPLGGGASAVRQDRQLQSMIAQAQNGQIPVTIANVQTIYKSKYSIEAGDLSESDRDTLAEMVYNSVMTGGPVASNSMSMVDKINKGQTTAISISDFNSNELVNYVQIMQRAGHPISGSTIQDALKVLSYYNQ